jgi:hypothetical protein
VLGGISLEGLATVVGDGVSGSLANAGRGGGGGAAAASSIVEVPSSGALGASCAAGASSATVAGLDNNESVKAARGGDGMGQAIVTAQPSSVQLHLVSKSRFNSRHTQFTE